MINLTELRNFLKQHYVRIFLAGIIFFVIFFSVSTLTTKPRLWIDEAITIELAHNFLRSGVLDIQVGPNQFSGLTHLLQSTGYPVTVILALIFSFFGYNFMAARIFMLLLMVAGLIATFLFAKKLLGAEKALLSVLLIASFASFYGSGRTAVGEIPGFIFLIIGIYFWLFKNAYYWSGLFFGLAIATKPSVFLLILPAIILVFLLERKDFFKKILKVGLGIIPAMAGWVFLVLKDPFAKAVWLNILNFYRNPYKSESLAVNVADNLTNFFHSTTLIYFSILFLIVILGRCWINDQKLKSFFNFVIFYVIIAFIYYLRSPGWLRYILIAELLIFFTIPSALSAIFLRFSAKGGSSSGGNVSKIKINSNKLAVVVVLFLAVIQFTNLFTAAQIYASDSAIKTALFINEKFPQKSIGIINALSLSVLLESNKKYQSVDLLPIALIGNNLLLGAVHSEVIVFSSDRKLSQDEEIIIDNYYKKFVSMNGYEIYVLKENNN